MCVCVVSPLTQEMNRNIQVCDTAVHCRVQFSHHCCWSRIAPVSGMVTLCLGDNALVIHTHYSNGCWYKDLLTLWWGGSGVLGRRRVGASLLLNAACILRPLSSASAAAGPSPHPPPPSLSHSTLLLELWWWLGGRAFSNVCLLSVGVRSSLFNWH